jgi:hypothetical protein
MHHDRNTAISDMEREWPFLVNGNNDALKRQGFPLTLNETSTIQSRSILINAAVFSYKACIVSKQEVIRSS